MVLRQRFGWLLLVGLLAATIAQADSLTYLFVCITNNNATSCATGEAQLFVDVVGNDQSAQIGSTTVTPATNEVLFRFWNAGPLASSITDVYFDDGALLDIAEIIGMTGVKFSRPATPANLPGGNLVSCN